MNNNEQINIILYENKIGDLKKMISKRAFFNTYNIYLVYLFYILQSAGIFTTTIAAGHNNKDLIWYGVGFNILASLVNSFEKVNNSISHQLLKDIISIQNNTYIDESLSVLTDEKKENDEKV
jgi:hypothetical protein